MQLTKEILPEYFTLASPHNSHYKEITNTFDFVNRGSSTLVVTAGDSWTWGADLDNEFRLQQVYGNIVSHSLGADWLNLAQSGSSNFFIAERIEELGKIIPKLNYNKIYLICTFTEVGRGFNSHHDIHINYLDWFDKNPIECAQDFDQLLDYINRDCLNRIRAVVDQFDIELVLGTNFVDAVGITDDPVFLPMPWYQLLGCKNAVVSYASSTGATRLNDVISFVPLDKSTLFKSWYIDLIDRSAHTDHMCAMPPLFKNHPTAPGHIAWANYILQHIK